MIITGNNSFAAFSVIKNQSGAGIYIHIPFCKQACHYCDFHFSTSLKKKEEMIAAIIKEIGLRKNELGNTVIQTIYFGGGTPSVLSNEEIHGIIKAVYDNFTVVPEPEITLEANPDDLSPARIADLSESPVNRLSIGIQSFFEEDLKLMNRAHNVKQAEECIAEAVKYFDNISIDLIYGIPDMSNKRWLTNIEKALSYGVPHISSYALTVEPKTALSTFIQKGLVAPPSDEVAQEHFLLLAECLASHGFIHYELSNFGKQGYFSQNNTAYWLGKKYLGIGPSAHSYNGSSRSWNIANNTLYLKSMQNNELPSETEILTMTDRYNEYVMTGLRTIWGVSAARVKNEFGTLYYDYLHKQSKHFITNGLLYFDDGVLKTTPKGKFLADGIASDLFFINLEK